MFILCRYLVYLAIALVSLPTWQVGLWLLLIIPLLMHLACLSLDARLLQPLHVGEAILVVFVLASGPAQWPLLGLAVWVYLAANTALWGWPAALWLTLGFTACAAVLSPSAASPPVWLAGACLALAAIFGLAICAAAHVQARRLFWRSAVWRDETLSLRRFLPDDLPRELAQPIQRTWIAVGFVDLRGFTAATAELSDEALSLLLNGFFAGMTDLVRDWGGHVVKFLGDGVLCVFPCESEAEGERARSNCAAQALRCLRQVPQVLSDMRCRDGGGTTFSATVGLAAGECLVGVWGGAGRYDYTVIGSAVNRAARLQGHAASHGGLLLDAATATLVAGRERVSNPLELDLKGLGAVQAHTPAD